MNSTNLKIKLSIYCKIIAHTCACAFTYYLHYLIIQSLKHDVLLMCFKDTCYYLVYTRTMDLAKGIRDFEILIT